jgi:hypothetical protein
MMNPDDEHKRFFFAPSFLQECQQGREFRIDNARNLISAVSLH